MIDELAAAIETERRLRVADIDGEEHRASESEPQRRARPPSITTLLESADGVRRRESRRSLRGPGNRTRDRRSRCRSSRGRIRGAPAQASERSADGERQADRQAALRGALDGQLRRDRRVRGSPTTSATIPPSRSRSADPPACGRTSRSTSRRSRAAAITVDEQIAEGDSRRDPWTGRGTHTGELAGIAPTGKDVTVSGLTISRFEGGKVVEEWTTWDTLGMLVQLGAIPEPARA